jgi:hypothetical protein
MKITKLDKVALKAIREPIEAELKALGERLGLELRIGSGSYSPHGDEASFKLEIKVDDPALKEAAARAQWDANCHYVGVDYAKPDETGLRPEDFGTEFQHRGNKCRTVGLALNRSKYPVKIEMLDGPDKGKVLLLTEQSVPVIRRATDAAKARDKVDA